VRHHAKASSAGSTQRQANRLGRFFRGAFAPGGASSNGDGRGAPSHAPTRLAITAAFAFVLLIVLPQAASAKEQPSRITPSGIEPYSQHPSGKQPYLACPPPTKRRATCDAIVVPRGATEAVRRNRRALSLSDQPGASVNLEGSGVDGGFAPEDLQSAYKLPESGGSGNTIAIVDAWDDPAAESDLATYRSHYGLPACTTANGCFQKVNQKGEAKNYPTSAYKIFGGAGWVLEASLDMDMASAICPECQITLVEANSNLLENLGTANNTAATLGATVISDSWGANEYEEETEEDSLYFSHPGIPILVSSGDSGYGVSYPSASPNVISVGGTSLSKEEGSKRGWHETAWLGAGSGCSAYEAKPKWQTDEGCAKRVGTDVAAVADPNTPVSVYSEGWGQEGSTSPGWLRVGGTSAAAPILAGVEARLSTAERAQGAELFWEEGPEGKLFDVADGRNGHCSPEAEYLCAAKVGYDGPTGWGTPGGSLPAPPVVGTYAASGVSPSAATLNGALNPAGEETSYRFEWGTTTEYGNLIPASEASAGSGTSDVEVSEAIGSLEEGVTYHYRLVATNSTGTTYGGDRSFVPSPWSAQFVPPAFIAGLLGVSCASATDCMAVGEKYVPSPDGFGSIEVPLAERWTGGKWVEQSVPRPEISGGYFSSLEGVSCSSPTACMAVGVGEEFQGHQSFSERWNGEKWELVSTPMPADAAKSNETSAYSVKLHGVSCPSSSLCIAVGDYASNKAGTERKTLVESWNGSKWSVVTSPNPPEQKLNYLNGVSCPSATSCFAVGHQGPGGTGASTLIELWNGTEWSVQSSPDTADVGNYLEGVSCDSSSSCMAVGHTYDEEISSWDHQGPLAEHWNGFEWSIESPSKPLRGISCLTADICLGVGAVHVEKYVWAAVTERWDGTEWTPDNWPLPPDATGENSYQVGVSCRSNRCTAVGLYENGKAGWYALLAERLNFLSFYPDATTEAATSVKATEATLNATVNPEGSATSYYFEYGTTTSYGTKIPTTAKEVGSGTSNVAVSQTPTGLSSGTTYHYRVVATNGEGTTNGEDKTLTTLKLPKATTEAATWIKATEAILQGTVNPEGSATSYHFEYGTTTSYGTKIPTSPASVGSSVGPGTSNVAVMRTPTGLTEGATYHYRVVAESAAGTTYGADKTSSSSFVTSFGIDNPECPEANPTGIAVSPEGNLWVTDSSGCSLVEEFNAEGEYLSQLAEVFSSPTGIAIDPEGNLWVADTNNGYVDEFNAEGEYLSQFGPGLGANLNSIAIDAEGNLWVVDEGLCQVTKYSPEGEVLDQFGSKGSGKEQLQFPRGIAIDAEGNLWVADFGNHGLKEFNAEGEYLRQSGGLSNPSGIAIDPEGNLWVTSTGHSIVREFNSNGEFLSQFGSAGSGNGQFIHPYGIAIDPEGNNLWVADTGNGRVQEWEWVAQFPPPTATTEAATSVKATEATLNATVNPEGLSTSYYFEYGTTTSYGTKIPTTAKEVGSGTSNVAVSQTPTGLTPGATYHYRVVATNNEGTTNGEDKTLTTLKLPKATTEAATSVKTTEATLNATVNPEGSATTYQFEWGKTTSYGTKIPTSAASVGSGSANVEVSEGISGLEEGATYHYRVVATSEAGTTTGADKTFTTLCPPSATTKAALEVTRNSATLGGSINPRGIATTFYVEYGTTTSYGSIPPEFPLSVGSGTEDSEVFEPIEGLKAITVYHFRVVATNAQGITTYGEDETFTTAAPSFVTTYGGEGSGNGQFSHPYGITIDSSGNLWIADSGNCRIEKFNYSGAYLDQFGAYGSGNGQFNNPLGIAIDSSGNLWIADGGNNRVQKFNSEGEYLSQFGAYGSGNGKFNEPSDIAIDSSGNLWVVDAGNNRVQKFNSKGEYLSQFSGGKKGQFHWPFGIAIDSSGNLWVTDVNGARVAKFNSKGEYLSQIGTEGSGDGQFVAPFGITIDSSDNLWVTDVVNRRVQKFNSKGEYLGQFGEEEQFIEPTDIALDSEGNIWVVDQFYSGVQEWIGG
jgi:DNA-binding beta-propeller fold protein YncE